MGSRSFEKSKEAWSSLVYNKDITQSEVLDAYKVNYYSERLCVLLTAACWLTRVGNGEDGCSHNLRQQ